MTDDTLEGNPQNAARILVAEFLLGNTPASQNISPSMLSEAAAMLKGIVEDLASLPNVDVTVLLGEGVNLFDTARAGGRIRIQRGELRPDVLSAMFRECSRQPAIDSVLLIAPECDGVLVSLLKAVQESEISPLVSLNLNWQLAEIFADKRKTDVWLRRHGIATIPTKTLDTAGVEALVLANRKRGIRREPLPADLWSILKPRDGAGAAGTQILRFCRQDFFDLPLQNSDNDRWVLQPFLPGIPCSIGFIGGGQDSPTTILPPCLQSISTSNSRISYCGGQVPCEPIIAARIAPIAEQLANALGAFNGYVGADILVEPSVRDNSEDSVRVVEINPRLCTSYVGYRALADDNLGKRILQQNGATPIRWKPGVVKFSAAGECRLSGIENEPEER